LIKKFSELCELSASVVKLRLLPYKWSARHSVARAVVI